MKPRSGRGHRYTLVLKGDPVSDEKQFFAYSSPVNYSSTGRTISLIDAFRPQRSRLTFAADESGEIRWKDLGSSRPVTREETGTWKKMEEYP